MRRFWTAVGVCVLLLSGSPHLLAQEAPVELTLRLAKGEVLYYSRTVTGNNYIAIGSPVNIPSRTEAREAVRVLDVADDGTMQVEAVDEDRRITVDGSPVASTPAPTMMRVRPDGRVAETLWGSEQQFFPFMLPGRPVAVGGTWTQNSDRTEGTVRARSVDTYTLAALEQTADGRVARIRLQGQGSVTDPQVPIIVPRDWRVSSKGTIRVSGEYAWSIDRGRLLSASEDLFFDIAIFITTPNGTASGSWTIRTAERTTPMPASAVTARPVDSAKVIVPGKTIGPYSMEMTISQLTAQLGAGAAALTDAGLRVLAVRWPPGLVGVFERDNQDKLVGLQIADVTYRTEKSIGFQSTQGQVVLAFGKPTIELGLPTSKSAVRLLIYDGLGLAFAIVADKDLRALGSGQTIHAPVGAVDWTDIFPPGTAGKIYPLP
ncbi:MAG TPA: hypothetical protein VGK88_06030 [bacterium]